MSYGYDNRYMLEGSFGLTGSENFAKGHRYGIFPAVGAAWYISNEAFMEGTEDIISKLKLRASYGLTGNDDVDGDRFPYRGTMNSGSSGYNFGFKGGVGGGGTNGQGSGVIEGLFEAPYLSWEVEEKKNVGIDIGLLRGQIDLSVDFFKNDRRDILMQRKTISAMTGFREAPWQNFGKVTNKGFDGNIIFKTSHTFPEPIMDLVNQAEECFFWSEREIPEDLDKMGSAVIKAFDIRGRFFHTEYFRLSEDKPGLGKKGGLVGLEVNMRPPGGYTPDMMNFANDINVYSIYANMAMFNHGIYETTRPYYCVYVGKRDGLDYKNSDAAIYAKYGSNICMHERMPEILGKAMGNYMFIARFRDKKSMNEFAAFVYAKNEPVKGKKSK